MEQVIYDNLERITQNIPYKLDNTIEYLGINALGESGVELLFAVRCKEGDLYAVQRAMNREFKLLFDENNISIPFPQIVVNQPENFAEKLSEK